MCLQMLWVDDNPQNNDEEIRKYAPLYHLHVEQLASSAAVRSYLAARASVQRRSAATCRLITDRHREGEGDDDGTLQPRREFVSYLLPACNQAGVRLVEWLRAHDWPMPALLYCGNPATVWAVPGKQRNGFLFVVAHWRGVARCAALANAAGGRAGVHHRDAARALLCHDARASRAGRQD